jgi:hypothetical protein
MGYYIGTKHINAVHLPEIASVNFVTLVLIGCLRPTFTQVIFRNGAAESSVQVHIQNFQIAEYSDLDSFISMHFNVFTLQNDQLRRFLFS